MRKRKNIKKDTDEKVYVAYFPKPYPVLVLNSQVKEEVKELFKKKKF